MSVTYLVLFSFFTTVPIICDDYMSNYVDLNFIDGFQRETMIRTYLPTLKVLQLFMSKETIVSHENTQPTFDYLFISFKSSFWIDTQRILRLFIFMSILSLPLCHLATERYCMTTLRHNQMILKKKHQ